MRWRTGYEPDGDNDPEEVIVEASTSADALHRLREVVGTDTDVIYVIPGPADAEAPDVEPAHIDTVARARKQWKTTGATQRDSDGGDFLREDSPEAIRERP
ncbi:hypothetical protein [Curtobacterium sp. MCSS17_011]|uniref:hypothetical protein n=1 Tax=Curtobacterium sp. MCSS17_011 TaxID=2175643 RepID=UPI0011B6BB3C|nr:hypothetical protein [Curtobacterium sp. MCSS17_011]